MKIKVIGLGAALLFMVACGTDNKETEDTIDSTSSATEESYVPPVGNGNSDKAMEQSDPNVATQDVQQMPAATPAKDISDSDLKKLSKILTELQKLNMQSQQVMMQIVQKNGLEVQKFMQIQQSMQDPNAKQEASAEDKKKFDAAMKEIGKVQVEMQQKMLTLLKKEGMTQQQYQSMMMTLQTNPGLQQKLMQMQAPATPPKTK